MLITQNGDEINMAALLIDGGFQLLYQGRVIDSVEDPDRKGQAAFTACGTTPTSEVPGDRARNQGRREKERRRQVRGDVELSAAREVDEFPTDTGTCAWTYKRVDTEDPGVPSCAEVSPTASRASEGDSAAPTSLATGGPRRRLRAARTRDDQEERGPHLSAHSGAAIPHRALADGHPTV